MGKMNARGRLFSSATRAWRRKADGSAQRGDVGSDNDGLGRSEVGEDLSGPVLGREATSWADFWWKQMERKWVAQKVLGQINNQRKTGCRILFTIWIKVFGFKNKMFQVLSNQIWMGAKLGKIKISFLNNFQIWNFWKLIEIIKFKPRLTLKAFKIIQKDISK
jgi:hypothetical protein